MLHHNRSASMDSFQPLYILKAASPPDKDHDRDPDKRPEFSRSNSHPTPFFTSLGPHAEDGPSFYDLTNSTSLPAVPLPAVPLRFRPIETIDTGGDDDNSTPELSPKVDPTPPAPPLSSTPEATLYTSNYSSSNSYSNINGTKEETASQSLAMEEDAAHGVYLTKEDVHFWSSLHTQNHSLNAKVHHDPSPTRTNSSSPSKEPSPTASPDEATSSSLVHIPSLEPCDLDAFEDDSGDEQNEALYIDRFTEEPDAGEHFMQATSEFFSKMG